MKNITVSLPDDTYRKARMRAAERDTSVSALVKEFFESLEQESEFERLTRLERDTLASIKHFSASDRLSREDLYDRRKVR